LKKSGFVLILTITLFPLIFIPSESFAIDPSCQFVDESKEINKIFHDKEFSFIKTCKFVEPINLEKKLIAVELFQENIADEIVFSLIDTSDREIFSFPINEGYNIWENENTNIVLDPYDFKNIKNKNKNFEFDQITTLNFHFTTNSVLVNIENPDFLEINDFQTFSLQDNLPVADPLPGFLTLIFVSFPVGFLVLNSGRFFQKENFIVKIPIILGLGFIIYLLYSFVVAIFWISFETILFFIIGEYVILIFYLIKNKNILNYSKISSVKPIIFFGTVLVISALVAVSYSSVVGWPTGFHDGLAHVGIISITVENNSYPLLEENESFLPIRDIPFDTSFYPKASHMSAAGLSVLLGTLPAISMISIFSFIMFLIPTLLVFLIYRFTGSIFFSSLMFIFSYFRPIVTTIPIHWNGDVMLFSQVKDHFPAQIGILITLVFFLLFLDIFRKDSSKPKLIFLSSVVFLTLGLTYQGYIVLPLFISIFGFIVYRFTNRKKMIAIILILVLVFLTLPLWKDYILLNTEYDVLVDNTAFRYYKYIQHPPWEINDGLFPLWISSFVALGASVFLLKNNNTRYLGILFIIFSSIQIISLSEEAAKNYLFYHQSMRSIGLWFMLSICVNLILVHTIFSEYYPKNYQKIVKKVRTSSFKVIAFSLLLILLIPSGISWLTVLNEPLNPNRIPGGNEKNLQYWLYENTSKEDLILNDLSFTTQWYQGFRAQGLVNFLMMQKTFQNYCNINQTPIEDFESICLETIEINEILIKPWNYDYNQKTISKYDIKYLYLSERYEKAMFCDKCIGDPKKWGTWSYSDNARIAMYENHPNLELVLRNGGSAIFKVI